MILITIDEVAAPMVVCDECNYPVKCKDGIVCFPKPEDGENCLEPTFLHRACQTEKHGLMQWDPLAYFLLDLCKNAGVTTAELDGYRAFREAGL